MMEYRIYHKRMIVTKEDFFKGNYNFSKGDKGELIALGMNLDDEDLINIFSLYNDPAILESENSLLLNGYWMESKEVECEGFHFAAESDFQEVADDMGLEEE